MVWINNKHETLSSTSDTMDATSMTASDFGVFLSHGIPSGGDTQTRYTVNGVSSGSKYALRTEKNGATDTTSASQDEVIYDAGGETDDKFSVTFACDIAGEEKLSIGFGMSRKEAGAGNAPTRCHVVWKYATTSARITSVRDDTSSQSGTYAIGSNLSAIGDGGAETTTFVPTRTNTIYEETDTAKYKWWDGSAWKMDGTEAKVYRGLFMGGSDGSSGTNSIEYITIPSLGNSTDFGDLTETKWGCAGGTNGSRGLRFGGQSGSANTASAVIDYVTIATAGNATSFGVINGGGRGWMGANAMNNNTRSVIATGLNTSNAYLSNMNYVTVATTGNSSDFGSFLYTAYGTACCDDKTRGVMVGGRDGNSSNFMSDISYITISTTGNATNSNSDMGYGSHNRYGTADDTRGVFFGGYNGSSNQNRIQYITIQSLATAIEFGDMSTTGANVIPVADNTRAVISSTDLTNDMEYVTIQTTGDSANFGDMVSSKRGTGAGTQGY